jgi:undecaprenyl pyrophosphate phosphatase UppP
MNFFDKCVYVIIATLYNIFIHLLTSRIYKNALYNEKYTSSVVFLIISGVVGIVISKIFMEHYKKYKNNVVSRGIYVGSIMLILTALFSTWDGVSDAFKLIIVGMALVFIIWCSYQKKKEPDDIDIIIERTQTENKSDKRIKKEMQN